MARLKTKGFKELQKKLKSMSTEVRDKAALKGTAAMARVIRDEARYRVYTAPAPWTVYYGSKGGVRAKQTFPAGSVADAIIMKRIPPSERAGFLSKHLVTVRKGGQFAAVERAALMMEYGNSNGNARFKPFLRPSLRAKQREAIKEAEKVINRELAKGWNK